MGEKEGECNDSSIVLFCETSTVQWRKKVERKRERVSELFYLLYQDTRCPVSPPVPHGLATVSAVLLPRPIYPVEKRDSLHVLP